jgi:hypothetical protein
MRSLAVFAGLLLYACATDPTPQPPSLSGHWLAQSAGLTVDLDLTSTRCGEFGSCSGEGTGVWSYSPTGESGSFRVVSYGLLDPRSWGSRGDSVNITMTQLDPVLMLHFYGKHSSDSFTGTLWQESVTPTGLQGYSAEVAFHRSE